jgi:hypothetical protein
MLWDLIYFLDWFITELEEVEEELVQEELRKELEELGYVGYMEFLDPDSIDLKALDLEFTAASSFLLLDNLLH